MEQLDICCNGNEPFVLGCLDLDDFCNINNTYGYQIGDQVIRFVSKIKVESFGELCGRTGGDEFLFILDDAGQITKLEDSLNQYLYRLRHNFVLRETGEVIPLGGSIGILRIK